MMKVFELIIYALFLSPVVGKFTFQSIRGGQTYSRQLQDDFYCLDYDMDFNDDFVSAGQYITDEFKQKWGVRFDVTATDSMSYTDKGVRIFDTSNPGTNNDNGDPDLGSPNEKCPNSGPGVGEGGPNDKHPNCEPLGNVIIIQENNSNKDQYPDDSTEGGTIFLYFDYPVTLNTLGLLDIEENGAKVTVQYADGTWSNQWTLPASYNNGYMKYDVPTQENVKVVKYFLPGSGCLADVGFTMCRPVGDVRAAGFDVPDPVDPADEECPEDL